MSKFNLSEEQFSEQYKNSMDEFLDICDWVTYIDSQTVVTFIYDILNKNNIEKPMDIKDFHDLYLKKYNIILKSKSGEKNLKIDEVINLSYELLIDLFSR